MVMTPSILLQRWCKPSAMKLASIAEEQPILCKDTIFRIIKYRIINKKISAFSFYQSMRLMSIDPSSFSYMYLNSEQLGDRADARRAIFDVYCEN
jgi:hypothetical protein